MIYLKTSVGIDISGEDLLIASLQTNLRTGVFTQFKRIAGYRTRPRDEVRREVDLFFRAARLSRDSAVLGIPRGDVIVRHLDLPKEVQDNLPQVIQYQVQSYEPTEEEKFYHDYAVLRTKNGGKRLSVLLVMVKQSVLDGYLAVMRELGIRPVAVTAGSIGLANLFLQGQSEPEKKTFILADLHASGLEIVALRDGALVYTREAARPEGTPWGDLFARELDLAVAKMRLAPEDTIDALVLSGESSMEARPEIAQRVDACDVIARSVPFAMPAQHRSVLQEAATSLGLAYSGLARRPAFGLNLLPSAMRRQQKRWAYIPTVVLGLAVIGLIAALAFHDLFQRQTLIRELDNQSSVLKSPVARVQDVRAQAEGLEKKVNYFDGILRQRDMNLEVLMELTSILPPDTFLTMYQNRGGSIQISGRSGSASDLIPRLEKSPLLKDVTQKGTVFKDAQTGKDTFTFEMKLER
jgi:Tfp pilus assembly protein PilN